MTTDRRSQRLSLLLGAVLFGLAFALKWWYRSATEAELGFMLRPASLLVQLFTGEAFTYDPTNGYLFHGLGIRIDRSCSGVNFLLITSATFTFLLLKNMSGGCTRPLQALLACVAAYALTILANTGRILLMLQLDAMQVQVNHTMHEAIGAFFFLASLLLASLLIDRLLTRTTHAHTT